MNEHSELSRLFVEGGSASIEQRCALLPVVKAGIRCEIERVYAESRDVDPIELEVRLQPVLRSIACLPPSEYGGCLALIRQRFLRRAPSDFWLSQTLKAFASSYAMPSSGQSVVVYDVEDLLSKKIEPPKSMLGPWLLDGNMALVHAWRGTGKSFFVHGIAIAVAGGTSFLGWNAYSARRVLIIDGELTEPMLQDRISKLICSMKVRPSREMLKFVSLDSQPNRIMPNLALEQDREALRAAAMDAELIIIDNLSSLNRSGRENEAESWKTIAPWFFELRSLGKSIILVHHSNKSGGQRGTSAKEDPMDTVIALRRPEGLDDTEGAVFEVEFEKKRHFYGQDAEPFLARYCDELGWTRTPIIDHKGKIQELKKQGKNKAAVARTLGIHPSTVGRNWGEGT